MGLPPGRAADRGAEDPGRDRLWAPPPGHPRAAGQRRLGPGRGALLGCRLVRRAHRLVRRGRAGDRARGPARRGDHPAEGSPGMTGPPAHPPARVTTSSDRLQRLLALVPYVISRKVVGLSETAAAFGVSERELVDDLNMLWCVELRAPDPYCPIDLSYEGGEIVVSQAESRDRPLRLGVDEASALLVALRMLGEVGPVAPGLAEGSALSRTIAKLEAAAGAAGAASTQVAVQVDRNAEQSVAAQVKEALASGRRVHLSYYVPGRDEATERDVEIGRAHV